ncbi:MAG: hypothetical protein PWQ31_692 [Eubacteriales bacterium]|nr:hypothetical protein [Eubacteriales bacterium]
MVTAGREKKLALELKSAWEKMSGREKKEAMGLGEEYKEFLGRAKTEREAVTEIVEVARKKGFVDLTERTGGEGRRRRRLRAGEKFFWIFRQKCLALVIVGEEPLEKGVNLIGAHLDAPRLDLKPCPLYEEQGLALFKTHYYGGIKKYQWLTVPLALHGRVIKSDGSVLDLTIGEKEGEPVFVITDLLPHLAKDQMDKKMREAIPGENLNILVGNMPAEDPEGKEKVKKAVLEYLYQEYGMVEEDFVSAEIEAVPAGNPKDVGFDRSMIGGYGQDDRICTFAALKALLAVAEENPARTAVALFVDKEEIGSTGSTGARSSFLENFLAELIALAEGSYDGLLLKRTLANTRAISADVNAAFDPTYPEVMDKLNAPRLGYGAVVTKYTGAGGKYSTSDADAEYMGFIRNLFNEKGVVWQTGELGKVDQGGGGTIAQFLARYTMQVVDIGVPLLSMHSPFEVASKADLYMAWKGYRAFFLTRG